MSNVVLEKIALATVQSASDEEQDARSERSRQRAKEAKHLVVKAEKEHRANYEDVETNVKNATDGFIGSFFGTFGSIVTSGIQMGRAKGGYATAELRRQASLAEMRANLARTHGDDQGANIEARQQDADRALEQTLTAGDRMATAVKIA